MHVLFVCTGNICRSPMAERMAEAFGVDRSMTEFTASSAGTHAVIGHPIHSNASLVIESLGGRSSDFAARQLTQPLALRADLILTMTRSHRDAVLSVAPRQLRKTFTLTEAATLAADFDAQSVSDLATLRPELSSRAVADIPDPIGRSAAYFSEIGEQIASLLPPILRLCR